MFLLLLSALSIAAPSHPWTLTVDPLTTALGFVHVHPERKISPHFSLYVGPHLRLFDSPWTQADERQPYLGVGIESGLRWFPRHNAPWGPWIMARGVVAHVWATDSDQTAIGGYGSALVGYTALIGQHFVLSGGAGVQRLAYGVGDYGVNSWSPALHTSLGVAFGGGKQDKSRKKGHRHRRRHR